MEFSGGTDTGRIDRGRKSAGNARAGSDTGNSGGDLASIRCAHCRRLDRRECMACRDQTEREGKELFGRLFQEK